VGKIVKTLARQGFMAPFGDSPSVGIGGITPGGGIGPLQRSIGLLSDNLIGVEMVDAKGRVIRADKNHHADLLWATRGGGGGNFGIYTKYKFKVHRAPAGATVFRIIWPWNQLRKGIQSMAAMGSFRRYEAGHLLGNRPENRRPCHRAGAVPGTKKGGRTPVEACIERRHSHDEDHPVVAIPESSKLFVASRSSPYPKVEQPVLFRFRDPPVPGKGDSGHAPIFRESDTGIPRRFLFPQLGRRCKPHPP